MFVNIILFMIINFSYFGNEYIIKIKIIAILIDLLLFVFEKIKINSKWFWCFVISIINNIPVLFVPKMVKIVLAFHFLINFVLRLFVVFLIMLIIHSICSYFFSKKREIIRIDKKVFKFLAIGLLFLNYQLEIAFVYAVIIGTIELIVIKKNRLVFK